MTEKRTPLDSATVAAYLRQHPEFFIDHDDLIPELRIPHQRGTAISLVERQVNLLRERNIEMRHRLAELMDVARENDRLFEHTRRLVLDLLDAGSLEEVVSAVEDSLRHEFKVPYSTLIIFSDDKLPVGRSLPRATVESSIGGLLGDKVICGTMRPHELEFLFAGNARHIQSAAMSTLKYKDIHGVLAVGSDDAQRYKSSMDTLFLSYISEVLARVLPRYLITADV